MSAVFISSKDFVGITECSWWSRKDQNHQGNTDQCTLYVASKHSYLNEIVPMYLHIHVFVPLQQYNLTLTVQQHCDL